MLVQEPSPSKVNLLPAEPPSPEPDEATIHASLRDSYEVLYGFRKPETVAGLEFSFRDPEYVETTTPKKKDSSSGKSSDRFAFSPPGMPLKSPEPLVSPALKGSNKATSKAAAPATEAGMEDDVEVAESSSGGGWGNMFKKFEEGKWKCDVCLARNENKASKCAACEATRPGAAAVGAVATAGSLSSSGSIGAGGFTFGAGFSTSPPTIPLRGSSAKGSAAGDSAFFFSAPEHLDSETPQKATPFGGSSSDRFAFSPPGMPLKSPEPLVSPALKGSNKATSKAAAPATEAGMEDDVEVAESSSGGGWGNMFKKFEEGKWKCDVCLARNENKASKCAACEATRPGAAAVGVAAAAGSLSSSGSIGAGGFMFGIPAVAGTTESTSFFGGGSAPASNSAEENFGSSTFGMPK